MRKYLSNFLMNEADSSPGNGAPAAAPAPTEPAAAPTAPVLDVDSLLSRLSGVIDEKISASQNATFAALRKSGALKQEKPQGEPAQPSTPTPSAPAAAQAGLSMADVEALLERERVIANRAAKHNLSEAQTRRLKSSLSGVAADQFATEVDSYLADMGLVKATPVTQTQPVTQPNQPAPAQPAKPNISDRGTAAPTDLRDSEGVINSRPLEATSHDVDSLIIKNGRDKGLRMFQERVLNALGNVRIKSPRG